MPVLGNEQMASGAHNLQVWLGMDAISVSSSALSCDGTTTLVLSMVSHGKFVCRYSPTTTTPNTTLTTTTRNTYHAQLSQPASEAL